MITEPVDEIHALALEARYAIRRAATAARLRLNIAGWEPAPCPPRLPLPPPEHIPDLAEIDQPWRTRRWLRT